jgi:hypothetical protein
MKKFIIISLLAFVALAVDAQRIDQSFVSDTAISGTIYFTRAAPIKTFDGVLGFIFTRTDIKDSCTVLRMQGAMESAFAAPVDQTGTGTVAATTTDGTYFLYVTSPVYLYYRLKATVASGDSVKFTNVRLIYK